MRAICRSSRIPSTDRIPLLDARLELTRHLSADERAELAGISLPLVSVSPGPLDLGKVLSERNAFGATVFDGIVMASLHVGEQVGTHLLGPADLLAPGSEVWPAWLAEVNLRAASPVKLGLLGNDLLAAVYRWPRIVQGLYAAMGDQLRRLTAQLVICQLPRVEDRIVAMLWLLAESWGQVTPGGVRVPLALTHETLGALVGSRRPTVSLALRKLTDEGALVPQDSGWLLLKAAPGPEKGAAPIGPVRLADFTTRRWAPAPAPAPAPLPVPAPAPADPSSAYAELRDTVRRLRAQHQTDAQQTREQLIRARNNRARVAAMRNRIAQDAVKRRLPPSS
jgi:CRP/FNR family transcriptional regulator, cyclic AMP receptor protein